MVVIHKGRCIMHCGMAAPGTVPGSAAVGPIGAAAMKSGTGNYLANLILFPGKPRTLSVFENFAGWASGIALSWPNLRLALSVIQPALVG